MSLKNIDIKLIIIVIISIIASINAAYLTYMAYTITAPAFFGEGLVQGLNATTGYACDINDTFSCSSVFSNDFAWIMGIPFSLIALFVYPVIVVVALFGLLKKIKSHYKIILALAIGGIIYNGYIIINEYLIGAYCFLCLICTAIIIINGILSIMGISCKK